MNQQFRPAGVEALSGMAADLLKHGADIEQLLQVWRPQPKHFVYIFSELAEALFAFAQRFFGEFALCNVGGDAGDTIPLPGLIPDGKTAIVNPAHRSVGAHDAELEVIFHSSGALHNLAHSCALFGKNPLE